MTTMQSGMHLTVADYVVTGIMLLIPVGIGVFYAWKDSKSANREEYLLGGRQMSLVPVTLSTFVTFQSAISLLGIPSDIYLYGAMACVFYISNSLGTLISFFTMVPLMHPLQLTSIYEYLDLRYQSSIIRLFCTVVGMIQTYLFMVIALLAPGLALQAAAGIPFWVSVAIVGSVGTLYTAIGGIKSVIWTDVFQTLILFVGLILLIIRGTLVVGGLAKVFDVAEEGGRISTMAAPNFDPRIRHTWLGILIGGSCLWQSNAFGQSNFQRISSMPTVAMAKKSCLTNIPCHLVYGTLLFLLGIIVYSYFYVVECDPLEGGIISNVNQISLLFMIRIFQDVPGLAGLYMATLFSGALSTLSSGINSLAANTVEDVLARCLRRVSERTVIIIAKGMVFVYGFSIVGLAYLAKSLDGPISQLAVTITGACGSISVGIFLMGCTVPWANKYGAFVGGFLSLVVNLWMVVGNSFHGKKTPPLPPAPTDQCPMWANANDTLSSLGQSAAFKYNNSTSSLLSSVSLTTVSTVSTVSSEMSTVGNDPYEYGFFLYDISYEWYSLIGIAICMISGLIVSRLTSGHCTTKTEARFIIPMLRNYWQLDEDTKADRFELDPLNI